MDGAYHSYAPDFYLPDYNLWLEVKCYWWGNDKRKMNIIKLTFPERKIVIVEKDGYEKIMRGELVW